jgi:uncharacterized protein (DUF58 family)
VRLRNGRRATGERVRRLRDAASAATARIAAGAAAGRVAAARVRRHLRVVTPLGQSVTVVGALAWLAGWRLGWQELMVAAGACLVLLVLAGLLVVGRSALRVDVVLQPGRVVAGDPSAGQLTATNTASRRSAAMQVELPVGSGIASFDVPSLTPGATADEVFVVPTERRGVIPVGPATSLRSDPLGLFHREAATGSGLELIVHPRTVPLPPFGSGLLRDLEGLTTRDLSVSDLAFHALREYAPGDDQRHVHWRSSAKAGRLLVRQFQDTRRSALCVVVDGDAAGYGDDQEIETTLSVAGSLVVRACRDGLTSTLDALGRVARGTVANVLLDTLARAEPQEDGPGLTVQISRAVAREPDISFAVLVAGSRRAPEDLQRAAARFPGEVRVVGIRVVPGELAALRVGDRVTLAQVPELRDLPGVVLGGVPA